MVRECSSCKENIIRGLTRFRMVVLAGHSYDFYVNVVTNYGKGSWSLVRKNVPPLSLKVSSANASQVVGRHGTQVHIYWSGPNSTEYLVSESNANQLYFSLL